MKRVKGTSGSGPIEPARIVFGPAGEPPRSALHEDLYHPRIGAFEQARHVFLQGNGLPQRWLGCERFNVLELGFGLGNNFLCTWAAWREDAARCERLCYVAIEKHPPRREDLARSHGHSPVPALAAELIAAWPPLAPGLHLLRFEQGRVSLWLALGDVRVLMPKLRLAADAIYLDGFAPVRQPQHNTAMWSLEVMKAVGRRAAPAATAATWSTAPALHAALRTAGFEVETAAGIGGKRRVTLARFSPRRGSTQPAPPAIASPPRTAIVIGAGIAGAAVAHALAQQGVVVTVLEAAADAAAGASGLPAGLFHGTVHADDGAYARLFRAAALFAANRYAALGHPISGLVRKADDDADALLTAAGLPNDYVRALDAAGASDTSGATVDSSALFYPRGGWIAGATAVRQMLAVDGITVRTGAPVAAVRRNEAGTWTTLDASGHTLAAADVLVLANGAGASALLAPLGHATPPLHTRRGQLTHWLPRQPHGLKLPLAGDGYAVPLPDGALLCGATRQEGDADLRIRHADHADNLRRLRRLANIRPSTGAELSGWVGFRLHSDDRLPLAGAVPLPAPSTLRAGQRLDQVRWLPRDPGLFVLAALGARGLTLAPLLGELVAAQATGAPWPLEQDLADAVDPGRWIVRAARRAPSGAGQA